MNNTEMTAVHLGEVTKQDMHDLVDGTKTLEDLDDSIPARNKKFEHNLHDACVKYLRDGIDLDSYVDQVQYGLWNGTTYVDPADNECYYEIPSEHTKAKQPVLVIPERFMELPTGVIERPPVLNINC